MAENELKVGVWRGTGPPPGYAYNVLIPDVAHRESRKFLCSEQYEHAAALIKDLATEADPTHSTRHRVDAVEDFHELKDKGGILGKVNLRIFFYLDTNAKRKSLVVLGAINKQAEHQTPRAVLLRMRRRLRQYLTGEWTLPTDFQS